MGPRSEARGAFSYEAQLDSPTWHLVQALNTLVKSNGHTPAVEGFFDTFRPLTAVQRRILEESIPKRNEAGTKKALGVEHWFADEWWHDSLVRLVTQPTINIEGLVAGYTGPGGKTILPHRAVAKIDMRLVPDTISKGGVEPLLWPRLAGTDQQRAATIPCRHQYQPFAPESRSARHRSDHRSRPRTARRAACRPGTRRAGDGRQRRAGRRRECDRVSGAR